MIEIMKNLAKEKDICVLATVSGAKPHCSLMVYATDEDCSEIYMATHRSTKKFKNLVENPSVSLSSTPVKSAKAPNVLTQRP